MRFVHFDLEDLKFVLALFHLPFRLSQTVVHVEQHVSDDGSHLIFDLKVLFLILCEQENKNGQIE